MPLCQPRRHRRGGNVVFRRRSRRRPRDRRGPGRRSAVLRALDRQDQVLQVPGQEAALPHRARQRLYRQHLAHPDDQDGQGLCGPAGRRGEAQGVQGRLDRRGRRRADRRDQQLHRFRLRRDRRQRAESEGLRAGHQARQGRGRRARRLRQHSRHRGRDQCRRRPEGPRRATGRNGSTSTCRTAARSSKCAALPAPSVDTDRHNGIHETLDATGKKWDSRRSRRQVGRSDRAEGDRRRHRRAEAFRRLHRAGRRHRRRAGDDRRQASDGAVRRRDRERLPQVLREAVGRRPDVLLRRHRPGAGRGRDQDRHRRARRPGRAAVGQAAARHRRRSELQGRRELLFQARDNFFVGNSFPTCDINFTAAEIMGQTKENK